MASKIKVDTLETANGSGTIALSNQLSGMTTASLPTLTSAEMPVGSSIQVVNFQTGAVATGTTTIPYDNTIPQITEGTEFMTLNFTPTSASSILLIDVVCQMTADALVFDTVCLFEGTTANALATSVSDNSRAAAFEVNSFRHKMTAGSTAQKTFRVRGGGHGASTVTFNGRNGGGAYNGTMASSITITEVAA
jgi:hypothetical protein